MGKGEITLHEQFLLFPWYFQKPLLASRQKKSIVLKFTKSDYRGKKILWGKRRKMLDISISNFAPQCFQKILFPGSLQYKIHTHTHTIPYLKLDGTTPRGNSRCDGLTVFSCLYSFQNYIKACSKVKNAFFAILSTHTVWYGLNNLKLQHVLTNKVRNKETND